MGDCNARDICEVGGEASKRGGRIVATPIDWSSFDLKFLSSDWECPLASTPINKKTTKRQNAGLSLATRIRRLPRRRRDTATLLPTTQITTAVAIRIRVTIETAANQAIVPATVTWEAHAENPNDK